MSARKAFYPWVLSPVEIHRPLLPGSKIGGLSETHGEMCDVYEVRRFALKSPQIAGEHRDMYAVLHAGPSLILIVDLSGEQTEWALVREPKKSRARSSCARASARRKG